MKSFSDVAVNPLGADAVTAEKLAVVLDTEFAFFTKDFLM